MVKIWTEDFHGATAIRWMVDGVQHIASRITSNANASFELKKIREMLAFDHDEVKVSGDIIGRHWDDMVIVLADRV